MANRTKIKQAHAMDCGAACLMSVAAHYKLNIPLSKIRQYAYTNSRGTNVLGLVEASEKLGFVAKGVKGDYNALMQVPKPTIAHLEIKNQNRLHYVVVYKTTETEVLIMDPKSGKLVHQSKDEFLENWTGVLLVLVPGDTFEIRNEKVSNIRRLLFLLRPHRIVMLQALIGAIFFSIIGLSTSIYIQKLTDFVFINGNKNLLNLMSVAMIFLIVVQIFLGIYQTIFSLKTGQLIDARLILGYYKHLLKLPQTFFDGMQTGEIIARINDAIKIRVFINSTLIGLIVNILIVVFSFMLMFIYSWKMALIVMLIIPMYTVLYYITDKLNKKTERLQMERYAQLDSHLVESINTIGTIKQFGLEEHFNIRTENRFIKLLDTSYTSGLNSIFTSYSTNFFARLFIIIVLWSGSYYVLSKELTPGELMSFYAILSYFTGPLNNIINSNKVIQNAFIASDRLFEIMDLEAEKDNSITLDQELTSDIVFSNVTFRYGSRINVFENLDLNIEHRKITAIVGETGSGKSSLIHILQNVYPISEGKITINKLDIRQINKHALRQYIGVVPQQINLFKGTIAQNIALADFTPDMNKVMQICMKIGLLDFIESLPQGFNTDIGENGLALSGGQRQKIALARVLYLEPEIIALDEATSALDSDSEEQIMSIIQSLKSENKTIIMIAHRLSTVLKADKIIVMSKGKIIEQGTHHELYANKGKYFHLWQKQLPKLI